MAVILIETVTGVGPTYPAGRVAVAVTVIVTVRVAPEFSFKELIMNYRVVVSNVTQDGMSLLEYANG